MDGQLVRLFKSSIPKLTSAAHKGQCGRVCIVGGSLEYTGAAYFAAISALKVGADLSYVLSSAEAAAAIKTYSPELIVYPYLNSENGTDIFTDSVLPNLHCLVIGPGLGRASTLENCLSRIVEAGRKKKLPIIFDADGLYFVNRNLKLVQNYSDAILTPNAVEFRRLHATIEQSGASLPPLDETCEQSLSDTIVAMAKFLGGPTILRKGPVDIISDGNRVTKTDEKGSPRRCGGQGDVLSGSLGTFAFWSSRLQSNESLGNWSWPLIASNAASTFTRRCSHLAFLKHARSTTTSDLIAEAHTAFEQLFGP